MTILLVSIIFSLSPNVFKYLIFSSLPPSQTGKYRGAACQECNGKMRLQDAFLPVFFHNFRGYDCHVICQEALGQIPGWSVEVIAQTREKYM